MNKILLLLLFISCNSYYKTSKDSDQKIISLERTACFGKCPIYKIEIFSDGKCIYEGKKFVEKIGYYNYTIPQSEIKKILSIAKKINFFQMKDEYVEPISDLPTTFILIKNKKVKKYSGAPKSLKILEDLIDRTYKTYMSR